MLLSYNQKWDCWSRIVPESAARRGGRGRLAGPPPPHGRAPPPMTWQTRLTRGWTQRHPHTGWSDRAASLQGTSSAASSHSCQVSQALSRMQSIIM
eukprot:scaffold52382_cov44-Prasinocladus_malaysianus.AAC.1